MAKTKTITLKLTPDEFRIMRISLANSRAILKDVHALNKKEEAILEKERDDMFSLFQKLDSHV